MTDQRDVEHALPRIAKALEDVSAQLTSIGAELRAIAAPTRAAEAAPEPPSAPSPLSTYPPPPPPAYLPPRPKLTEWLGKEGAGSKLLVWIGGAVTLVGVVLMLVLAIQRGWIGPVPRVLLGAVLAGALLGVSLVAHRTPAGRAGAFALAATGIAALYLDLVAATALLDLLPSWLGLGAGLLVAGAGLVLASKWNAQPLAAFVLVGCALSAPFITQELNALLLGFLLVLHLASAPVQLIRSWIWVPLVAGIPPILVAVAAAGLLINEGSALPAVGMSLLASLVTAAIAFVTALRRPDDGVPLLLLASAAIPTLALGQQVSIELATGAAALFGLPMIVAWVLGRSAAGIVPAKVGMVAGGIGAVCVFYVTALRLSGDARAAALPAEGLLLSLIAATTRSRGVLIAASGFTTAGTALAVATIAQPERILLSPLTAPEPRALAMSALAFGLIGSAALAVMLVHVRLNARAAEPVDVGGVPQLLGAMVALYGACGLTLSLALLALPDRSGFLLGHSVVTVSWMIIALVLLQRGITERGPRIAGLVLVGAALLKLVLFDLSALDGIGRAAAFLGAGLVLLGAGVRYTRLVAQHAEKPSS